MRNADLALYDAKNSGKNRYAVFAPTMHEAALARLSLTSDLRHAIERNELVVHYQPLVDLESGDDHRPRGAGALEAPAARPAAARPVHRARRGDRADRPARPDGAAARRCSRRCAGSATPTHAGAAHRGQRQRSPAAGPGHRRRRRGCAIKDSGIDAVDRRARDHRERAAARRRRRSIERLNALADLGVHLYIDDFGTGYSSLSYLQMLPVNGLKLAQEFVETLPGSDTESGLVRTIRDLAETLGLSTIVAEGIERPEQWRSLLSLGYSVGQGFHLAVPMPAERVPTFLSGHRATRATATGTRLDGRSPLRADARRAHARAAAPTAAAPRVSAAEVVASVPRPVGLGVGPTGRRAVLGEVDLLAAAGSSSGSAARSPRRARRRRGTRARPG